MTSNSNIEIILIKYATAVLDAKNGVTNPTLGEMIDPAVEAIQQELLKARIDELNKHIAWADENVGGITLSRQQLDDRITNLQAKLMDTTRESE